MKKIILSALFVATGLSLRAQEIKRCYTVEMMQRREELQPGYLTAVEKTFEDAKRFAQEKSGGQLVYEVRVVFHVVYKTAAENIPDSVLFSQVEVLNEDYRRRNADTALTRDEFKPFAADAGIEFYLAHTDPDGNWTDGITRTQTTVDSWVSLSSFLPDGIKQSSEGGADAWDTERYLNIWVGNLSLFGSPFLLGFAYPPVGAPNWTSDQNAPSPELEGVVLHYEVVGRNNPLATGLLDANSRGRTCSHEVGHYMGLRHIWGDGGGFSGVDGCTVDDGISDTPNCSDASQQTCDLDINSCTDSPVDYNDMIENYMDYSDEHCLNMFTQQQVDVMRSMLATVRNPLVQPFPASVATAERIGLSVFPNPSPGLLEVSYNNAQAKLQQAGLYDSYGRLVQHIEPGSVSRFRVDISENAAGVYFLQLFFSEGATVTRVLKY